MIVILDHLEIDIEISGADMKTIKSNDCREISGDEKDTNGVLAIIQEKARFSCKDGQKFIDPFTQSISGLCQISELYSRTKE